MEKLEWQDGFISLISNIDQVVNTMQMSSGNTLINLEKYHKFLYDAFNSLGKDANFLTTPDEFNVLLWQQQQQVKLDRENGILPDEGESSEE